MANNPIPMPQAIDALPFGAPRGVDREPVDLGYHIDEKALVARIEDPLDRLATDIRALTAEQLWTIVSQTGQSDIDRKLVAWAIRYQGGEPFWEKDIPTTRRT